MKKQYKIISLDLQKNLIEFLDEIQFDAAKTKDDADSMQIINFCNWAIKELLDSYDGYLKDKPSNKKPPQKKSRDEYVEETFMDWNLPDMDDDEYEKLVDQFDAFLRSWEQEYNKKNPKADDIEERPFRPTMQDVAEHCTLDEIEDMLKDDPELSDSERFDLYYEERQRIYDKKTSLSYTQLMKQVGISPRKK